MGNASPRYTPEFKQRAVDLYRQSGTTYAEMRYHRNSRIKRSLDWRSPMEYRIDLGYVV